MLTDCFIEAGGRNWNILTLVAGCFALLKQVAGTRISSHSVAGARSSSRQTGGRMDGEAGFLQARGMVFRSCCRENGGKPRGHGRESSVRSRWTNFIFATRRSWNHKLNPCFLASWFLVMSHQNSSTRPWSMLSSSAKSEGEAPRASKRAEKSHPERQYLDLYQRNVCVMKVGGGI